MVHTVCVPIFPMKNKKKSNAFLCHTDWIALQIDFLACVHRTIDFYREQEEKLAQKHDNAHTCNCPTNTARCRYNNQKQSRRQNVAENRQPEYKPEQQCKAFI